MTYRSDTEEVTLTIRTIDKVRPPRPAWWRRLPCLVLPHRWRTTHQVSLGTTWLILTSERCARCGHLRFSGREVPS